MTKSLAIVLDAPGKGKRGNGAVVQGARSPAIYCGSSQPVHGNDERIVQIMGKSSGVEEDVDRSTGLALRQPASSP